MKNDFRSLVEFLGRCEPEVAGRGVAVPETETAARLERFASGDCNPKERADICVLLRANPNWMRWVADRVKEKRAGH